MKKIIIVLASLTLCFSLASAQEKPDAATNWKKNCAKCHAPDGSGKTKMGEKLKLKDYTDAQVQASLTDDDLFKATKEGVKGEDGKEKMPGYAAKLSDDEIKALVTFIRAMKK